MQRIKEVGCKETVRGPGTPSIKHDCQVSRTALIPQHHLNSAFSNCTPPLTHPVKACQHPTQAKSKLKPHTTHEEPPPSSLSFYVIEPTSTPNGPQTHQHPLPASAADSAPPAPAASAAPAPALPPPHARRPLRAQGPQQRSQKQQAASNPPGEPPGPAGDPPAHRLVQLAARPRALADAGGSQQGDERRAAAPLQPQLQLLLPLLRLAAVLRRPWRRVLLLARRLMLLACLQWRLLQAVLQQQHWLQQQLPGSTRDPLA